MRTTETADNIIIVCLVSTILTIRLLYVDSEIISQSHGSPYALFDIRLIHARHKTAILNMTAASYMEISKFGVLLFIRGNVFSNVHMERVCKISSIGNFMDHSIFFHELLALRSAKRLSWSSIKGSDITQSALLILNFSLIDIIADMLQNLISKRMVIFSDFVQRFPVV